MRLREGAHRRSDSFADDRGSRRRFEQALRGRQPPFETARFGRCHGDSIDVEFFCELTIALSTWRQTGATVMLVPSGARISFRPPRLRIEIGTRPRAEARWHAQSERIFIGGKFQRELLVVASRERCRRARSYLLHAIGHSQITRLAAGHSPLSRPHPVELEP